MGPPCLFRDMVCLFALQLQGRLCDLLLRDNLYTQLVSALLTRLDEDQEKAWLDFFLQELVGVRFVRVDSADVHALLALGAMVSFHQGAHHIQLLHIGSV